MKLTNKKLGLLIALFIFTIVPLILYAFVDLPQRTTLKETLSLIIYLAFMLFLAQFFIARTNALAVKIYKTPVIIKVHKVIGYIVIPIFFVHPFLIVLPKFFEPGLTPMQAFVTIITTFNPWGVLLGVVAWVLMLVLGLTSMFRSKLNMKYQTWRLLHSVLAIAFIAFASWHAINLGRHISPTIAMFIIFLALGGSLLLAKTYFFTTQKREGSSHE